MAGIPFRRVDECLELVGLSADGDRSVGGYSMGMRQRLELARAMLGEPDILVLDEPANGLDPQGIAWLRDFLKAYAGGREGRIVLVSSHLLSEAQLTVEEVIIVASGRLAAQGRLQDLLSGSNGRPGPDARRRPTDRGPGRRPPAGAARGRRGGVRGCHAGRGRPDHGRTPHRGPRDDARRPSPSSPSSSPSPARGWATGACAAPDRLSTAPPGTATGRRRRTVGDDPAPAGRGPQAVDGLVHVRASSASSWWSISSSVSLWPSHPGRPPRR